MRAHKKFATIAATVLHVLCPECGEPQLNPGNADSEDWLPSEIEEHEGTRQCIACDEWFRIVVSKKAVVIE